MRNLIQSVPSHNKTNKLYICIGIVILLLQTIFHLTVAASPLGHTKYSSKNAIKNSIHAMLFFDCTKPYGLNAANYHPETVKYDKLHSVLDPIKIANNNEKADFELKLTDALITQINHLHFRQYKPNFKGNAIDEEYFALQTNIYQLDKELAQKMFKNL